MPCNITLSTIPGRKTPFGMTLALMGKSLDRRTIEVGSTVNDIRSAGQRIAARAVTELVERALAASAGEQAAARVGWLIETGTEIERILDGRPHDHE